MENIDAATACVLATASSVILNWPSPRSDVIPALFSPDLGALAAVLGATLVPSDSLICSDFAHKQTAVTAG